jgi:hypothetical protein
LSERLMLAVAVVVVVWCVSWVIDWVMCGVLDRWGCVSVSGRQGKAGAGSIAGGGGGLGKTRPR